jgi:hypothetical protein
MTDDPTKDLTDSEKLTLILAKLSDVEARLAKLEAQKNNKRPRPDSDSQSDVWLDYSDAAEMMRCPAAYFRRRNGLGEYEHWPQIERWQPGGRRTRLYVRREHVEAWIEASRTPPPCPIRQEFNGNTYASILPELRRMGADRVIRSLGLDPMAGKKAKKTKSK